MKLKKYSKYKNSGIDWIGNIPEDWNVRRFKINFQYKKGKIPKELFEEKKDNNYYPYLSMDVLRGKEGSALFTTRKYGGIKVNNKDLLLLWDGSNAGEFVVGKEGFLSSTMVKFHLKNINKDYSYYLTNSFESVLRDLTIGMGIPHVNGNDLNNIKIPFVDIHTQKNISSFLDSKTSQIEKLIEKDIKIIELLKEKRVSLINKAVTKGLDNSVEMKDSGVEWIGGIPNNWEVRKLKFCVSLVNKKAINSNLKKIGLENIESSTGKFIQTKGEFEGDGVHFKKDDVLFGKLRPYLEKVYLSSFEGNAVGDVLVYRKNKATKSKFIFYRLISHSYIKIIDGSTYGTKMPRTNSEFIGELPFPIPSIDIQEKIVEFLDKKTKKINNHIKKVEKRIEFYEEYKKSVIYNVVTGKVEV